MVNFTGLHEIKMTESNQAGFTVKLARSDIEVFVPEYSSILHVLMGMGIDLPYSCRGGSCGACEVRVLSGTPDHRDSVLSDDQRAANQSTMVCCSGSISPVLELDL